MEKSVVYQVLNFKRNVLVEELVRGCQIFNDRQVVNSTIHPIDVHFVDLDARVQSSEFIHLLLHEAPCGLVVDLDSADLVNEIFDFDVELIFVGGDIVKHLDLRMLHESLQLSQAE